MNRFIVLLMALALLAAACDNKENQESNMYTDGTVSLAGKTLNVEVADTSLKQAQGLSGRSGLSEDEGMLFVYNESHMGNFWMKDMIMPIDIIWINGDKVIDISSEVQPEPGVAEEQLKRYSPNQQFDLVLEVRSGWAKEYGVKAGDVIKIELYD